MYNKTRCIRCNNEYDSQYEVCPHCGHKRNAASKNPLHLPEGTMLGEKYILGEVIGQGGFGITYAAFDIMLEQKVAIKEYFPQGMSSRTVQNPIVFPVADPSVMEYLDGMNLSDFVKANGGRIPWHDVKRIFNPIMKALAKIHTVGIVHRDIAPDNILITEGGDVKLIDFGAARQAIGEKSESLSVILKPGFAPPEQYHTHGKQGPWTDIYALGATIYRALSGITPTESLTRIMNDDLRSLCELGVMIPKHSEIALAKSLNLDEKARFQSMDQFRASLFEGAAVPKSRQRAALIGGGESFAQKAKITVFKPLYIKITVSVLATALVIALLFTVIMPSINYNTALAKFNGGDYDGSADGFRELGSYKDSVMLLARSLYRDGEDDYEKGLFTDAITPFAELARYYPDMQGLVTDAKYMQGVSLGVNGTFEDAIDVLQDVAVYKNADALIVAAQQEDVEPFIEEAIEHELPVTEAEVVQAVAENEDYSEEVVEEHIEDAQPAVPVGTQEESAQERQDIETEEPVLSTGEPVQIIRHEIRQATEYTDINLLYPEISGLWDSALEADINTSIATQVQAAEQETVQAGEQDMPENWPYFAGSEYLVCRNDGMILSLYVGIDVELSDGENRQDYYSYDMCFNIHNSNPGWQMGLADLFIEGCNYISALNNAIIEQINETPYIAEDSKFVTIEKEQEFLVTDDALLIFLEYDEMPEWFYVTSNIMRSVVSIPLENLSDILIPELQNVPIEDALQLTELEDGTYTMWIKNGGGYEVSPVEGGYVVPVDGYMVTCIILKAADITYDEFSKLIAGDKVIKHFGTQTWEIILEQGQYEDEFWVEAVIDGERIGDLILFGKPTPTESEWICPNHEGEPWWYSVGEIELFVSGHARITSWYDPETEKSFRDYLETGGGGDWHGLYADECYRVEVVDGAIVELVASYCP